MPRDGRSVAAKQAVNGSSGDAVCLRDLTETLTTLPIIKDGGVIELEPFSSDVTAFELGAPHAGANALDDQVAFEFRDGADDHNDSPAQRTPSIDLLPEAYELDVQPVQLVEYFEEVTG